MAKPKQNRLGEGEAPVMGDVHSLFGTALDEKGVNPDVVKTLTDLLDEAKRGEIVALSVAFLDGAGTACSAVAGAHGRTAALAGAITMLQHRYCAGWSEHAETLR